VARDAVFRAQPIHGGAKAAGARTVEVGDLNDTHTAQQNCRLCAVNDLTSTVG
jgi:seryl-tRNA(Sec) selenium transferase